jgi:hypothetical protein
VEGEAVVLKASSNRGNWSAGELSCALHNGTTKEESPMKNRAYIRVVTFALAVMTFATAPRGLTASADGTIYSGVTVTGPYTVNSDCTGTLAQSDGTHYNFVAAADGSTVYWIETDTGNVITGTEVQFRPSGGLKQ